MNLACIGGKQCKKYIASNSAKNVTSVPLEPVHSDLCGKMAEKSLGGAEYLLTFLNDKTHFAWVYPLKTKDQFLRSWHVQVQDFSGHQ